MSGWKLLDPTMYQPFHKSPCLQPLTFQIYGQVMITQYHIFAFHVLWHHSGDYADCCVLECDNTQAGQSGTEAVRSSEMLVHFGQAYGITSQQVAYRNNRRQKYHILWHLCDFILISTQFNSYRYGVRSQKKIKYLWYERWLTCIWGDWWHKHMGLCRQQACSLMLESC